LFFKNSGGFDMIDATSQTRLAEKNGDTEPARARIRRARWEDWALPASLAFAVFAVLLLHYPLAFVPITTAAAADPRQPDYVMTITAKRLPSECRGSLQHVVPATCAPFLTSNAVIKMRETGSGRED
jgi:hypothetical protein